MRRKGEPAPQQQVGGPPAPSLAENPDSLWAWENEGTYQNSMAGTSSCQAGLGTIRGSDEHLAKTL